MFHCTGKHFRILASIVISEVSRDKKAILPVVIMLTDVCLFIAIVILTVMNLIYCTAVLKEIFICLFIYLLLNRRTKGHLHCR